ncbi:hypothetical protein AC1031_014889 [Aphanomyces cochlioides]|nr:hypothetical protein AC1031_014889 [Aphanomyces cochlioides]
MDQTRQQAPTLKCFKCGNQVNTNVEYLGAIQADSRNVINEFKVALCQTCAIDGTQALDNYMETQFVPKFAPALSLEPDSIQQDTCDTPSHSVALGGLPGSGDKKRPTSTRAEKYFLDVGFRPETKEDPPPVLAGPNPAVLIVMNPDLLQPLSARQHVTLSSFLSSSFKG